MARPLTLWFMAAGGRDSSFNPSDPRSYVSSWICWPQRETPQSNWIRTLWGTALALDLILVVLQATIIGVLCGNDSNITLTTSVPLVQHSIFLAMSIYNFGLLWDALHRRNFPQLLGAIVMHFTSAIYAILQAALGVTSHSALDSMHDIRIDQALIAIRIFNAAVVSAGAIMLASIVRKARRDFGWRVFKHLGADPRLKRVYAIHHTLLAAIKINVFYFIIYLLQYGLLTEISAKSEDGAHWIEYDDNVNPLVVAIIVGAGIPLSVLTTGLMILAIYQDKRWMLSIFIFTLMLNNGFLLYHITMASMQAIQYGHTGSEKFIISLLITIMSFFWTTVTVVAAFCIFPYFGTGLYRHVRCSELPREILPPPAGNPPVNTATFYENNRTSASRWSIE